MWIQTQGSGYKWPPIGVREKDKMVNRTTRGRGWQSWPQNALIITQWDAGASCMVAGIRRHQGDIGVEEEGLGNGDERMMGCRIEGRGLMRKAKGVRQTNMQ